MIRLEKIDDKNVWDIIDLKLTKEQKIFVAPNDISIVQAYTAIGKADYCSLSYEPETAVAKKLYNSLENKCNCSGRRSNGL